MIGARLGLIGGDFRDPDAQVYINAVVAAGGTLSDLERRETHILFCNLKGSGPDNNTNIWTLIDRLWPVLGGVSASVQIDIRLNQFLYVGSGHTINASRILTNGTSNALNTQRTDANLGNNPGMGYMVTAYRAANGSSGAVNTAYTSRLAIAKIFAGGSYRNSALSNESLNDSTATNTFYIHTMRAVGETTGIRDFSNLGDSSLKTAAITAQVNAPVHFGGLWQSNGFMGAWVQEDFSAIWLTKDMSIAQAQALRTCMLRFKSQLSK
jgi:hypothetical protein